MKHGSLSGMDGWFQMVSSRSKSWLSIISVAPIVAEKWTFTQKLNLKPICTDGDVHEHARGIA